MHQDGAVRRRDTPRLGGGAPSAPSPPRSTSTATSCNESSTRSALDVRKRAMRSRFVALTLIWGASFLFIRIGVEALAPLQVAFGRMLFGALHAPGRGDRATRAAAEGAARLGASRGRGGAGQRRALHAVRLCRAAHHLGAGVDRQRDGAAIHAALRALVSAERAADVATRWRASWSASSACWSFLVPGTA